MISSYRYQVKSGSGATSAATVNFDFKGKLVIIKCFDKPMIIRLANDEERLTFGDDIEISEADPPLPFPFSATAFTVRNKTAGQVARYQLINML